MADSSEQQPFILGTEEGDRFDYLGGSALFKITDEQTGAWNLSVETFPPGFASALHSHPNEHSGFYIMSGAMRVKCGVLDATATAGSFIWLPRAVPHAFKVVSDEPCTWINVQGPTGDFRKFIELTGHRTARDAEAVEPADRATLAARHRPEILGPSPFD